VTEEADHLRTIVQRLQKERPLLVEGTILACVRPILAKLGNSTDETEKRVLREVLEELELLDEKSILESISE
jgi:hypothetical protein